ARRARAPAPEPTHQAKRDPTQAGEPRGGRGRYPSQRPLARPRTRARVIICDGTRDGGLHLRWSAAVADRAAADSFEGRSRDTLDLFEVRVVPARVGRAGDVPGGA